MLFGKNLTISSQERVSTHFHDTIPTTDSGMSTYGMYRYSSPRTRNTNEENFVNVLIPPEKPRTIGEFTRKRLAAAKYAKG